MEDIIKPEKGTCMSSVATSSNELRKGPLHPPLFQVGVRRPYRGLHKHENSCYTDAYGCTVHQLGPNKSGKMSIKAFKYRIYANPATTQKLHWVLDRCRELYNAGLQERRDAYEMGVRRH